MESVKMKSWDRPNYEQLEEAERRLFGNLDEIGREQRQLLDNSNSNWYRTCKKVIQFYLDVNLIKFSPASKGVEPGSGNEGHLQSLLQFAANLRPRENVIINGEEVSPPIMDGVTFDEGINCKSGALVGKSSRSASPGESWQRWKYFIIIIYLIWVILLSAKFSTLVILQYKFDISLEAIRTPTISNNFSSRNYYHNTCKETTKSVQHQIEQVSDRDRFNCDGISSLFIRLEQFGNLITSLKSLCISCYGITVMLVVYCFIIPIFCISVNKFRPDNLAFILNPLAERARLHREVVAISGKLVQSMRRRGTCANLRTKGFVKVLLDIIFRSESLVEPAITRAEWHRQSTQYWAAFLACDSTTALLVGIIYFFGAVAGEFIIRTRIRLHQLGFNSDVLSLFDRKGNFYIQLKQLTDTDLEAYRAFDGTMMSYLNLALLVESKYSLRWEKVLLAFETVCMLAIAAVSASFYSSFYWHSCTEKIVWANQIRGQIEHCSSLLQLAKERCRGDLSIGRPRYIDDEDSKISKLVTISYLNFELFRRQQKFQQKLIDRILLQIIALCFSTLFICYLVGSNLESAYTTSILLLATYIGNLANISFVTGAFLTYKIDRIFLAIMKLLAGGVTKAGSVSGVNYIGSHLLGRHTPHPEDFDAANSSISYPIAYWRRQLLDERMARQMLAPSVLGISLTFDRIVTFNAYLAGLWLVARR